MRRKKLEVLIALVLTASPVFAQGSACDRACLERSVDQFVDAFVRHDPKLAPLTRAVKFTENGQTLPVGDGSWRTMVAKGTYHLYVSDPKAGQAYFSGAGKCNTCHSASGDLAGIGRKYDPPALQQRFLFPQRTKPVTIMVTPPSGPAGRRIRISGR